MNANINIRRGRLVVIIAVPLLACLLFLALSQLQPPVYSQGLSSSEVAGNALRAEAPAATPTPCPSVPPTGRKATIVSDDEILLTYRFADSSRYLRNQVIDNPVGSTDLIADTARNKLYSIGNLDEVHGLAGAAADLNGDGKEELVSAFKNHASQIGAISNPYNTAADNDWFWNGSPYSGDVKDIDVASGDLDRGGDNDEVAVAFKDNNEDPRVVVLDGSPRVTSGAISNNDNSASSVWTDSSGERGNVNHVAVETGDLNGDGADDEIVVAFKDSGSDLQVVILRHQNETATLKEIWQIDSRDNGRDNTAKDCDFWHNRRPIDVTTGDVDGDMVDEAVVAFRVGSCDNGDVQLLLLDVTGEDAASQALTIDSSVWMNYTGVNYYGQAWNQVSVSTGDLDGDGVDEIALGGNVVWVGSDHDDRHWQQHLATFEYVPVESPNYMQVCQGQLPGCLHQRSGTWSSGSKSFDIFTDSNKREAQVVVAAGDLEQDGLDEVALVRYDTTYGDPQVLTFDADSGLALRRTYSLSTDTNSVWEFSIDMGDQDGDSLVADYTGACFSKAEARVLAVIHAPPHGPETGCDWTNPLHPNCAWGDNYLEAQASFGTDASGGEGYSTGMATTMGAEVGMETKLHEIGPSFTYEWEKRYATEASQTAITSHGSEFETRPAWIFYEEASDAGLQFIRTEYDCYVYHEASYGDMDVCLPIISGDAAYSLKEWYSEEENGGLATYPDSWVPVGIDLAQGRTASQSSEYTSPYPAGRAVDGNINGNLAAGSVSHTGYEQYASWEVDLGSVQQIDGVQIWNRTDCCGTRLANFYLFVSEEPFPDEPPSVLAADPTIWHHYHAGPADRTATLPVDEHGRYVRVQLDHQDYLHLAEVQVWGTPGEPDQWPTARPASSDSESFTLTWPGDKTQVVPGQLLYTWPSSANYKYVGKGVYGSSFGIGLEQEGETIEESSTANKAKLGMSIKYYDGSVSYGVEQQTSYILSWSQGVDFHGEVGGLPSDAPYTYYYAPYVWLQRSTSAGGVDQAFFVLDYWLQQLNLSATIDDQLAVQGPRNNPTITPTIPLLDSPTHPDPATWVVTNTATFNWRQPPGDPATIAGYRWHLDRVPDTVPNSLSLGPDTSATYEGLGDGVLYMHVRAVSDSGQWSDTAHRAIRIDTNPPVAQLSLDPALPNGDNDWYVSPVTVTAGGTDGAGSGVTGIEVSTDGVTWMPYTTPLVFNQDTPGATVYARATDGVGFVSQVVSTTFMIDQTPPDSHVAGGAGPGALVATVFTNTLGNQELVLAGAVTDHGSGRSGMSIEYDGLDWTGTTEVGSWPGQPVDVSWVFTATHELGAGNHIFLGRAQDVAGNQEQPYEIARVLWYPRDVPDITASSLTASPSTIRPGDVVNLTLMARNAGWQEAHVAIVETLPAGLTPVTTTLGSGASYDPAAGTITWPDQLLWPGQWIRHTFAARADVGLPAATLENQATFHAFWPNTDLLPPAQQQPFLDREQTVTVTATVAVAPGLPAGTDHTPPWVILKRRYQDGIVGSQVQLAIAAAEDARWMYLREWTPDPVSGAWNVARSSGWIDVTGTTTWTLSPGQGVKYLGVWVADRAQNISTLDEYSLIFVNRLDGNQALADGQRVQYRGDLEGGTWLAGLLTTVAGDPDLYAWGPRNGFRPNAYRNDTVLPGQTEDLGHRFLPESGRYLVEVEAVGDSEYQLVLTGHAPEGIEALRTPAVKPRPPHPLVVSDPLSAGQVGTIDALQIKTYLPVMFRNN